MGITIKINSMLEEYTSTISNLKCASNEGLLDQPTEPLFRTVLVEAYADKQERGGTDKCGNGNRNDSIFLANGVIRAGIECDVVQYTPE